MPVRQAVVTWVGITVTRHTGLLWRLWDRPAQHLTASPDHWLRHAVLGLWSTARVRLVDDRGTDGRVGERRLISTAAPPTMVLFGGGFTYLP